MGVMGTAPHGGTSECRAWCIARAQEMPVPSPAPTLIGTVGGFFELWKQKHLAQWNGGSKTRRCFSVAKGFFQLSSQELAGKKGPPALRNAQVRP